MSDFDENSFSQEVYQEFLFAKIIKTPIKPGEVMKENAKTFSAKLFANFVSLVDSFSEKTLEKEKKKRKFTENDDYANSIISISENKKVICQALDELRTNEILTDEKFVKRFTQSLSRKISNNEIAIPLEKVLFALIAYKIFEAGIESFCEDISNV